MVFTLAEVDCLTVNQSADGVTAGSAKNAAHEKGLVSQPEASNFPHRVDALDRLLETQAELQEIRPVDHAVAVAVECGIDRLLQEA